MKNRRNIVIAFLLCACMIVGVGYAALSDVMDVTGTTTYNEDKALDASVYFAEPGKSNDENNIQIVSGNTDKVSFNIDSLAAVGNYTYFWVKIVNDSDKAATIAFKEYSANTDGQKYYQMSYNMGADVDGITTENYHALDSLSWKDLTQAGEVNDSTGSTHTPMEIAAHGSEYLCIKVTLKGENGSMPSTTVSATFNFEITATTAA